MLILNLLFITYIITCILYFTLNSYKNSTKKWFHEFFLKKIKIYFWPSVSTDNNPYQQSHNMDTAFYVIFINNPPNWKFYINFIMNPDDKICTFK